MLLLGYQACYSEENKEETVACLVGLYWSAVQTWMPERGRVSLVALEDWVSLGPTESEENYGTRNFVTIQIGQDLGSEAWKRRAGSEIAQAAALDSWGPYYFVGEKLLDSVAPDWPLDFDWG